MKSVRTAVQALRLLGAGVQDLGVTDVSRHLKIPKSSASRLLAALGEGGLLEQDSSTRRYRPGPLAVRLGALYRQRAGALEVVREAMVGLASRTGHSCSIGTLVGNEVAILDGIHGGYPVRFDVHPGDRLPTHSTSLGRALLACLDDEEVRRLFPSPQLRQLTEHTVTTVDALLRDLAHVRARGWSRVDQETFPGINAIAVAFAPEDGGDLIALSITYPVASIPPSRHAGLVEALLEAAYWVGERIGDPRWAGPPPQRLVVVGGRRRGGRRSVSSEG